MPTYDYRCQHCGPMEIVQRMSDSTLTVCPKCGSSDFSKEISAGVGVIFKGDGFWETDYNRSSDYQSKAKADSGGASGGSTDASTDASTGGGAASTSKSSSVAGGDASSK